MATKRPIRFGLAASFPATLEEWRDLARKVEDLGYATLLVPDHMGRQWSPLLACLAAADATTRLRVGTQVIANDFRNPVVLAKESATLDVLTGGRFELGIGVGHPASSPTGRSDYRQIGMDMDEPGPRVSRLAESLTILRSFFEAKEPFEFQGRYYRAAEVQPYPRPLQAGGPPIMVAGAGPRMLKLAATHADIINIAPRPPTVGPTSRGSTGFGLTIHDELTIIKQAAADRYPDLELSVFADRSVVTDDADAESQKLADEMQISRQQLDEMPATLIGSPEAIADRILEHRERFDITYRIIRFDLMDAMAPVVARLSGE